MAKKKTDKYASILEAIDTELRRQNSFKHSFLQGVIRGVGTAFGATILVALVTSITIHFAETPQAGEFMKAVIKSLAN